ncbi:mCG146819 [Mus musculus]|jgi:hypothetical protein|uniref:Uncharacterized protein n=1 Tax=Mus musculus TaxID=10090 RepID=Q8C9X9_MOUSE|nr:mCG146819 [Mus musculus]BAC30548.1 unnamed protein product [Mus musculus]
MLLFFYVADSHQKWIPAKISGSFRVSDMPRLMACPHLCLPSCWCCGCLNWDIYFVFSYNTAVFLSLCYLTLSLSPVCDIATCRSYDYLRAHDPSNTLHRISDIQKGTSSTTQRATKRLLNHIFIMYLVNVTETNSVCDTHFMLGFPLESKLALLHQQ